MKKRQNAEKNLYSDGNFRDCHDKTENCHDHAGNKCCNKVKGSFGNCADGRDGTTDCEGKTK